MYSIHGAWLMIMMTHWNCTAFLRRLMLAIISLTQRDMTLRPWQCSKIVMYPHICNMFLEHFSFRYNFKHSSFKTIFQKQELPLTKMSINSDSKSWHRNHCLFKCLTHSFRIGFSPRNWISERQNSPYKKWNIPRERPQKQVPENSIRSYINFCVRSPLERYVDIWTKKSTYSLCIDNIIPFRHFVS